MSTTLDQLLHHQRILVTGKRSAEIIATCCQVLDHYNRSYDLATSQKTTISTGPIVFIEADANGSEYDPHIALIDHVTPDQKTTFTQLADGMPKSGTLVFNEKDKLSNEICSVQRTDVHLETYADDVQQAAMALLKRVGISEESFKLALN